MRDDAALYALLAARTLTIDGTEYAVHVDEHSVRNVYAPLARLAWDRCGSLIGGTDSARRLMVGIAGPPGAGKTATAAILSATLEELACGARPVVVPLDGFHYPNTYLDAHTGPDHDGRLRSLRALKGWHVTFDAGRARELLRRVRAGDVLRLPAYSRALHDPVEDSLSVDPGCNVVLVEGNYLFLDEEPWCRVRELFDLRIFITAPVDVLCRNVTERHVRGGKPPDQARTHVATVDLPNIRAVLPTERHADVVVRSERGSLCLDDASVGSASPAGPSPV